MAYVKKTLAPGEDYLYRAKFNWTYDFISWFWLVLGLVPAGFWGFALLRPNIPADAFERPFIWAACFALLIGVILCFARFIYRWTTVIAITSVRIIMKHGLIARISHEVSLDKIEEVLVQQSFLGRIFGFGKLTIRGTGMAIIEFPNLARPTEIRRKIEEAVVLARELTNAPPSAR